MILSTFASHYVKVPEKSIPSAMLSRPSTPPMLLRTLYRRNSQKLLDAFLRVKQERLDITSVTVNPADI